MRAATRFRLTPLAAIVLVAATGCYKVDRPDFTEGDDAATVDGAPPDALVGCEPDTIVCDDDAGRYVECGSDGVAELVMDCPLGCYELAEKCLDVAPSNGLAGYLDLARDDEASTDVVFTGSSTIDTDTGEVTVGGVPTTIPTIIANGIRVYMFKSVEIPGTLKVTGTLPVALVSDGTVTITGVLDVSADSTTGGPGSIVTGPCVGGDEVNGVDFAGGGGGGRFQSGSEGGYAYPSTAGGAGGDALSDADLQPLVGGCRGGLARGFQLPEPPPNGGGGGGAVQIVTRGPIALTGGGVIDASGGGGSGSSPGPGGGSGGGVLLEAPTILLDGSGVVISSKGGAGAGARSGLNAPGEDGGTGAAPAAGGSLAGYAAGGNGGTDGMAPQVGDAGNATNTAGAGGGGSVGESRFNTQSATVTPANGAAIRSRFSVGTIGTRLVP